jgi:hypothetical protein
MRGGGCSHRGCRLISQQWGAAPMLASSLGASCVCSTTDCLGQQTACGRDVMARGGPTRLIARPTRKGHMSPEAPAPLRLMPRPQHATAPLLPLQQNTSWGAVCTGTYLQGAILNLYLHFRTSMYYLKCAFLNTYHNISKCEFLYAGMHKL